MTKKRSFSVITVEDGPEDHLKLVPKPVPKPRIDYGDQVLHWLQWYGMGWKLKYCDVTDLGEMPYWYVYNHKGESASGETLEDLWKEIEKLK